MDGIMDICVLRLVSCHFLSSCFIHVSFNRMGGDTGISLLSLPLLPITADVVRSPMAVQSDTHSVSIGPMLLNFSRN
jgi:hypothetical protein